MSDLKSAKEGFGKALGPLEQEIMEALWIKGPLTGKEVFNLLRLSRENALTTVLTVLERLTKKGLVKKVKGETVYIFEPACTKEEFARKFSEEVLRGIFEISASSAAASFVDMVAKADPMELDRLEKLIEEKKKSLKGGR